MITLRAHAVHLNGEETEVRATLGDAGGSFGRGSTCDLVLPDPDRRISRLQGQIEVAGGRCSVGNASTSNPMYINGMELAPGASRPLTNGDELRAGSYIIMVEHIGVRDGTPAAAGDEESDNPPTPAADPAHTANTPPAAASVNELPDPATPVRTSGFPETLASRDPLAVVLPRFLAGHAEPGGRPPARESMPPVGPDAALHPARFPDPHATQAPPGHPGPWMPADAADPDNPFGDLLAGALPIGEADQPSTETPLSHGNPFADPGAATQAHGIVDGMDPVPDGMTPVSRVNPLAPGTFDTIPAASAANTEDMGSSPALSGDPFADLMGAPITSQIAGLDTRAASGTSYIPDDFNPLAAGGAAQRNAADPLSPLGADTRGLPDVQPQADIDSIYAPGAESPTALVQDALRETADPVLDTGTSLDPLKLFGGTEPGILPGARSADRSASDHVPEMGSYFRAPVAVPENTAAPAPAPDPVQAGPAPMAPALPPESTAATHDMMDSGPPAEQIGGSRPAERGDEELVGIRGLTSHAESGDEEDSQAQGEPVFSTTLPPRDCVASDDAEQADPDAASAQALLQAFKRGAGVEHLRDLPATPETMEQLGQMLQIAVQGAVSLLAARAAIKQEVHMPVTLINPRANNPLKFLPDGHTALQQMLGPRMPGFMPAITAMQEAFDDLLRHESGIAAGTQATIEALFQRFDPARMESKDRQKTMGERASRTVRDAHLWRAYVRQYESLREEIRDDFFRRLGGDFQDAYNNEYGSKENGDQ